MGPISPKTRPSFGVIQVRTDASIAGNVTPCPTAFGLAPTRPLSGISYRPICWLIVPLFLSWSQFMVGLCGLRFKLLGSSILLRWPSRTCLRFHLLVRSLTCSLMGAACFLLIPRFVLLHSLSSMLPLSGWIMAPRRFGRWLQHRCRVFSSRPIVQNFKPWCMPLPLLLVLVHGFAFGQTAIASCVSFTSMLWISFL